MSFTSLTFLAFACGFFAVWPLTKRHLTVRYLYIALSSLVFYGWADRRLLLVILPFAVVVFVLGLAIDAAQRRRKTVFVVALSVVLGVLLFFKYSTFLSVTAEQILGGLGIRAPLRSPIPQPFTALPLGISFYTFQAISYLIDVYRRQLAACRNPLQFLAYVSLFPNLVAGPIVRAKALLPQLSAPSHSEEGDRWEGLRLIAFGYFKKAMIADNLLPDISQAFGGGAGSDATLFWWSITAAYALQIYFDFSGYTDIARGLARWMGFDVPPNFDHPYTARSVSGFWTRWHMTLSFWFRDYLFLPLSYALMRRIPGERLWGVKADYWVYSAASLVTMLLCGLWHGAAWTFVLWGGAYGIFLIVERVTKWPRRLKKLRGGGGLSVALTLLQVWTLWVLFRAASLHQAGEILRRMFVWRGGLDWGLGAAATCALILGILIEARTLGGWRPRWWSLLGQSRRLEPVFLALLILFTLLFRGPGGSFIYFRF